SAKRSTPRVAPTTPRIRPGREARRPGGTRSTRPAGSRSRPATRQPTGLPRNPLPSRRARAIRPTMRRRRRIGRPLNRLEVLEHGGPLLVAEVIAEGVPALVVGEDRGVVNVRPLPRGRLVVTVLDLGPAPAELLLV